MKGIESRGLSATLNKAPKAHPYPPPTCWAQAPAAHPSVALDEHSEFSAHDRRSFTRRVSGVVKQGNRPLSQ